ncbi:hypothetical protein JNW88_21715, partial [Micromonospora sp. ATA32]|nr:hypothetical protein [Micromonospora sp. ATA32]
MIAHAASARPEGTDGGEAGLVVVSVAAGPRVAPADVLAAAYELSATAADGGEPGRRS